MWSRQKTHWWLPSLCFQNNNPSSGISIALVCGYLWTTTVMSLRLPWSAKICYIYVCVGECSRVSYFYVCFSLDPKSVYYFWSTISISVQCVWINGTNVRSLNTNVTNVCCILCYTKPPHSQLVWVLNFFILIIEVFLLKNRVLTECPFFVVHRIS